MKAISASHASTPQFSNHGLVTTIQPFINHATESNLSVTVVEHLAEPLKIFRLQRFSYDLEIKTREQNRNNKRTEIERFDWFIERIQMRVAFGWLSKRSGKITSYPRSC